MKALNENELRKTEGGNIIVQIASWGIQTYHKWQLYKEANQPIGKRQVEDN